VKFRPGRHTWSWNGAPKRKHSAQTGTIVEDRLSTAECTLQVSHLDEDRVWDAFVSRIPYGDYVQTSLYAQVKAVEGWRTTRLIVWDDDVVIAGAQLLVRPLSAFLAIGYVPRGPLISRDDSGLLQLVVDALHAEARRRHLPYLVLQPPRYGPAMEPYLLDAGFGPSPIQAATTATTRIDLTQSLEEIMSSAHRSTRRNIRRGLRNGITLREGGQEDMPIFERLHEATSQRRRLSPYPREKLYKTWQIFAPHGYVKLFVAEVDKEPVSAQLTVPFGDTLISRLSGWSGEYASLKPNEALEWYVIQWAKSQCFHYYDLDGIDDRAASHLLRGQRLPDSLKQTWTTYKLGFGGEVIVFPKPYSYVYHPLLRFAYRTAFPRITQLPPLRHRLALLD
jgi:lipid II:glycine glycyltransferase (peptidoglycan interpeptide bridge formation enzyme)